MLTKLGSLILKRRHAIGHSNKLRRMQSKEARVTSATKLRCCYGTGHSRRVPERHDPDQRCRNGTLGGRLKLYVRSTNRYETTAWPAS
jgi:hypothetical protein